RVERLDFLEFLLRPRFVPAELRGHQIRAGLEAPRIRTVSTPEICSPEDDVGKLLGHLPSDRVDYLRLDGRRRAERFTPAWVLVQVAKDVGVGGAVIPDQRLHGSIAQGRAA